MKRPAAPCSARGEAHVAFAHDGQTTRLADLYQKRCAKILPPRVYGERQAVLLNTAGGDRLDSSAPWGRGASAIVTSQAAERIYRSLGDAGRVTNRLVV